MKNKKLSLLSIVVLFSLNLMFAPTFASADIIKEVQNFEEPITITNTSETEEEILSVTEFNTEETKDFSNLTIEEANKLNDADYMEYQMQKGNYTVDENGAIVITDNRPQVNEKSGKQQAGCVACVSQWKVYKTGGTSTVYGSWKTIASGWGPGSLGKTVSETRSNSYSGTLSASKSAVNGAVGFDITQSTTKSVHYSGNIASGKQGYLQTRPAYTQHTVKQDLYRAGKYISTTYIYPKKYVWTDHRIGY
ncbi:hypothetical protein COK43_21565 [Bacillus cereus]|nr:hypothetical protein COK43_21565 [Bacillus cereus]